MESMTSAVTQLIESNEAMIKHKESMDDLTQENRTLTTRINRLENEHYKLKDKFDKIEKKNWNIPLSSRELRKKMKKMKHNSLNMCIMNYLTQLTPRVSMKGGDKSNKWK